MIQANKVIYSSSHGGQKYISNKPYIDPKIRPIGKIYYTRYITFYLYSDPLTISTFFSMFPWSNYGNTLSESLELATLFLTMLSNVPRRLSADHLLPYYATATEVSYLKYVDGSITGGDISWKYVYNYFTITVKDVVFGGTDNLFIFGSGRSQTTTSRFYLFDRPGIWGLIPNGGAQAFQAPFPMDTRCQHLYCRWTTKYRLSCGHRHRSV